MSTSPPPSFAAVLRDPLGPPAATRRGTWAFVLFVVAVAFYDLGGRSLDNLDLPRFGVLAREMIRTGEWLVPTRYGELYANKPPLYIWMIALPASLYGAVTPFLVRLPCALGLVAMVLSTAAWGRTRGGSVAVGRAAGLLLLGTFLLTRLGRESRPDMLAAGLAAWGTFLLDARAEGGGRASGAVLTGLVLGLAVLAKGPAVLLVPVVVLLLPSGGRPPLARVRSVRPLLVGLTFAVVVLLWVVPAWGHVGSGYAKELLVDQALTRVTGQANKLEPLAYYAVRLIDSGAPWTLLYLLPLALLPWPRGRRRLGPWLAPVLAALLVLLVFTLVPTKHVRYVVGVFPLLALAAAGVVGALAAGRVPGPRWAEAQRVGAWGLALLGVVVLGLGWIVPGALAAAAGPAAALFVLAAVAGRSGPRAPDATAEPAAVRRRFVGVGLVAVVVLLSAFWVFRDRYRVREGDQWNAAVAAAIDVGVPFVTVGTLTPADVFAAAPDARWVPGADAVPPSSVAPRLYVLLEAAERDATEAVRGEPGELLLESAPRGDGQRHLLLGFRATPAERPEGR